MRPMKIRHNCCLNSSKFSFPLSLKLWIAKNILGKAAFVGPSRPNLGSQDLCVTTGDWIRFSNDDVLFIFQGIMVQEFHITNKCFKVMSKGYSLPSRCQDIICPGGGKAEENSLAVV